MPVGRRAVYDKINGVETQVSRALVRETSRRLIPVIEALGGTLPDILPGYPVRILDGSHLAASEHRIGELRRIAAGPLPGQSLVVLDPRCMLPVDVFPCEDGHAQERSILLNLPDILVPGEVWIADRNFCVAWFLFEIANNHAFFVIRQHAANVRWEPVGQRHKIGRTSTGMVYEQMVRIHDDFKNSLEVRRITIVLDEPTEDGDTEIHLLTNLPRKVKAVRIADAYRHRWTIEGAFAELAKTLNSEISSLGYPPAALFGFCLALVAYSVLSVVKAALRAEHGVDKIEKEVSGYYLANEISGVARGMMIAIPSEHWKTAFANRTPREMAKILRQLAKKVNLLHFKKHPRAPKKAAPKRTLYRKKTHVSTAKILAARK